MTCHKTLLLLSDYIDGTLTSLRSAAVRSHLERCPTCRREWQTLRAVLRLTEYHGRERCPIDLSSSVLARIHAPARPERRRTVSMWMAVPVAAAACAVWCSTLLLPWLPSPLANEYRPGRYSGFHAAAAPSQPEIAAPVHAHYRYTTSLGATDGLLLSLSVDEP